MPVQVDLGKLVKYYKMAYEQDTAQNRELKYMRFSPKVKSCLEKISQYLKKNKLNLDWLHRSLDRDQDNTLNIDEFVDGMRALKIDRISAKDYKEIFRSMDADNNQFISINELKTYLEGAQRTREERISEMPREVKEQIERDLEKLFKKMDDDGNDHLDKYEIIKAMRTLGVELSMEDCEAMIAPYDVNNDGTLDFGEFKLLMEPRVYDNLLNQDDRDQELRNMFLEADTNYSGFLSVREIYTVLLKKKMKIDFDELIALIEEYDHDEDAQLDIDEFVHMMNQGSDANFKNPDNVSTYMKFR